MISEGSCDTGDWSNDDDNTALITEINLIWKYIKIENYFFFKVFKKHKKSYWSQTFDRLCILSILSKCKYIILSVY